MTTTTAPGGSAPAGTFARGLLFMTVASVGFAVMSACAQRASRHVHFLEIAGVRALVGALAAAAWARVRGSSLRVVNHRVAWARTLSGTAAMICTFYALGVLPLADASALGNTTPIFVAILGALWLRERVGALVGTGLGIAVLGALLVLDPRGGIETGGGIAAMGAAVLASIAMVSLRRLGATESPEAVVFHFSAFAGIVSLALASPFFTIPSAADALWMLGAAAGASVGQLAMTRAYALDRAARVGAGSYLQIVFATLIGVVLFGQPLPPRVGAGIAAIVVAGALLVWSARRDDRLRAPIIAPPRSPG